MRLNSSSNKVVLICKRVGFYSEEDETAFFEWAQRIKCVRKIQGVRDEIWLHLRSIKVSDRWLRELLALFYRYKIDMTQLQQFLNQTNSNWFNDKDFWFHNRVFRTKPSLKTRTRKSEKEK